MAVNFQTSSSSVPLPQQVHVAVTWNNATIIWSSLTRDTALIHLRGQWIRKQTSGDVPKYVGWPCRHGEAQVCNDKMFILQKNHLGEAKLHSLDLNTVHGFGG